MIDTLCLVSRERIPEHLAKEIRRKSTSTYKLKEDQNLIISENHRLKIACSWEAGLMASLEKTEFWEELPEQKEIIIAANGQKATQTHEQKKGYRLRLEGSPNKITLGHNVFGGFPLHESAEVLINTFREATGYDVQHTWEVSRADWAESFLYPTKSEAKKAINLLCKVKMPRKDIRPYEGESIYCSGPAHTWKGYLKGPEFRTHDRARLRRSMHPDCAILEEQADRTIRIENEFRKRYLIYYFQTANLEELPDDLTEHWKKQTEKALQDDLEMKRTHDLHEAQKRLYEAYSTARANALYGTWLKILTLGEKTAREGIPDRTWYRHRSELKAAGVALYGIKLTPEESILDFSLESPYRLRNAA